LPGIEHAQAEWLRAAFTGKVEEPPAGLVDPGRPTPNQRALGVAIGLAWCRLVKMLGPTADAYRARSIAFYRLLAECGHQAVTSAGYGDEQGAPAPHDALWWYWRATMLREARLQGLPELHALASQEAGEELALCAAFWTPAGVRQPGSRAKGAAGLPLRPVWATCSWAYALIAGIPTSGLDKPDQGAIAILKDCRSDFAAIRAGAKLPKLHIPVRKWAFPDGSALAALDRDEPMNNRLSWVAVDAAGAITGASETLADLPAPDRAPDLVIGGDAAATPLPAPVPQAPPAAAPSAAGQAALRADFSARLAALSLAKRDQATRSDLLRQLGGSMTPEQLLAAADRVAGFGIGEGQAQAIGWRDLVEAMRLAGT